MWWGNTQSLETAALHKWTSPDGEQGKIGPLVANNLMANLLGQDMLSQMDGVLTTDHRAFYDDILEEEAQDKGWGIEKIKGEDFFTHYRNDPNKLTRVYPQS